ncbi:GNAT family N-acetyltransferase [Sulfobacillus sp. DSM 109850]|uniref:GNAT family N-acetyltransferase n=2 Tax=Sulfobacillus harzensis TaxID=2729629 RepID=A0A7Y0L1J7_9FIRM|nr:GNAT family N-acetyltransferase [Sulfobacillus harzensis]
MMSPDSPEHRSWLINLWTSEWGGDPMVSGDHRYYLRDLEARIAIDDDQPVGAVTWAVHDQEAEIVSLNALVEGRHIGTRLIRAVEEDAVKNGVTRVFLTTTNDNVRALAFYQKRGYRLTALNVGAVDRARQQKPAIPVIAANGIPIHDELILAKRLQSVNPH